MNILNWSKGSAIAALAIGIASQSVQAQELLDSTDREAPRSSSAQEGDDAIVVTAQRRNERIQDVPIALVVQSGEQLERSGIVTISDLQIVTPGLRFTSSSYTVPAIRGIYSQPSGPGNDANVAIYVDDVYQPDQQANGFDLPDIQRIEVLKGPQGTLFGRNVAGGAIRVFTKAPSFEPEGSLDFGYGRFDDLNVKAYLAGPIVPDLLAASVSGYYRKSDGYNLNVVGNKRHKGIDKKSIRAKLRLEPGSNLSVDLIVGIFDNYDGNINFTVPNGSAVARLFPGSVIPTKRREYAANSDVNEVPRVSAKGESAALKIAFDTGAGMLSSMSTYNNTRSYNVADGDQSSLNLLYYNISTRQKTISQELVFSSNKIGNIQFTAGLNYYDSDGSYDPLAISGTFRAPALYGFVQQSTKAYAAFGEVTYDLMDHLSLIAGLRFSNEKRRANGTFTISNIRPDNLPPMGSGKASFESFTPRASLRYTFASGDNIYVTYSEGFKSGGFNLGSLQSEPFRPEKLKAFEIGLKTEPRRAISANISAFYYDYANRQERIMINGTGQIINAATATIYGADAEVTIRPSDEFRLVAGISYLHARYDRFPDAILNVPTRGPTCLCGNTTAFGDLGGAKIANTPDLTIGVNADYRKETSIGTFELSGNLYYSDEVLIDVEGRIRQEPYALIGGRLAFEPSGSGLTVYAWGKNLTDEPYIASSFIAAAGDGLAYGSPRTYGIGLKYAF